MVSDSSNDGFIEMNQTPAVSIILPVYNAGKFLKATIQSVLAQTFTDFELIIINDGSTDLSEEIIQKFTDPRIIYLYQNNQGLGQTLANALQMARGNLIARQDADDIALPTRLEKQIEFMRNHPEIVLLGTWADIIDENDQLQPYVHQHPVDHHTLKLDLVFNNPFVHSSVVFRYREVNELGGYSKRRNFLEDFDLWSRLSHRYQVANLPETLLLYREVASGISKSNPEYTKSVITISANNIHFYLPELAEEKCHTLARIYHGAAQDSDQITDGEIETFIFHLSETVLKSAPSEIRSTGRIRHTVNMKRKFYNARIYTGTTSFWTKLIFRIKRKWLFTKYPKLIES